MLHGNERFANDTWGAYGPGTENEDLPGYAVLLSGPHGGADTRLWTSGFIPSVHQGAQYRSKGDPILFRTNPAGYRSEECRRELDALKDLNEKQLEATGDPEVATHISQYELAFRMQTSVPELMTISGETKETLEMHGV
jgi:hypothetical protein